MTAELKCPTCESPEPRLHPASQAEGEVTHVCPDPFHIRPKDRVRLDGGETEYSTCDLGLPYACNCAPGDEEVRFG